MKYSTFLDRIILIVTIVLLISCDDQVKKIEEISYLSQIYIPPNSEILNYHDNLETSVAYKIHIGKNKLKDFIEKNTFKALDTLDNEYGFSLEHSSFHSIESGFVEKEKIYGKNLRICKQYSTSIILNQEESIIWGITDYPVVFPDSIRAKKP